MEKVNESKQLTRECITTALLILTEEKPYEKITISEITKKAGVSRMAYYRNYIDKDDILLSYIESAETKFFEEIKTKGLPFSDMIIEAARFFQQSSHIISTVANLPLSNRIFGEMTSNLFHFWPQIQTSRKSAYTTAFYTGAVISVFRNWLESGMAESLEDIAAVICDNVDSQTMDEYNRLVVNREDAFSR